MSLATKRLSAERKQWRKDHPHVTLNFNQQITQQTNQIKRNRPFLLDQKKDRMELICSFGSVAFLVNLE